MLIIDYNFSEDTIRELKHEKAAETVKTYKIYLKKNHPDKQRGKAREESGDSLNIDSLNILDILKTPQTIREVKHEKAAKTV